eukprot:352239-Chlamydomonas_euryale.AAC.6
MAAGPECVCAVDPKDSCRMGTRRPHSPAAPPLPPECVGEVDPKDSCRMRTRRPHSPAAPPPCLQNPRNSCPTAAIRSWHWHAGGGGSQEPALQQAASSPCLPTPWVMPCWSVMPQGKATHGKARHVAGLEARSRAAPHGRSGQLA